MKKIHILIPSLMATVSTPLISLVGCGNKEPEPTSSEYTWDYVKNQGYTSQVKPKVTSQAYKKSEAIVPYLTDVKQNPMILIDDVLTSELLSYYQLFSRFGGTLSKYTLTFGVDDIDVDNKLVSVHYSLDILVNDSSEEYVTQAEIEFKNIPFCSYFLFEGTTGFDVPMWLFVPSYSLYGTDVDALKEYLKSLTFDWDISGSIYSSIDYPGDDPIDVEFDLNATTCDELDYYAAEVLQLFSPFTYYSNYFYYVKVKADYDLVYDSTNDYMHLQNVTMPADDPIFVHMSMKDWGGQPSWDNGITIKFFVNGELDSFSFIDYFDNYPYESRSFAGVDVGHYQNELIVLKENSEILLSIHPFFHDVGGNMDVVIHPGIEEI